MALFIRSKDATFGAPGLTTSNKKLLGARASLLVTRTLRTGLFGFLSTILFGWGVDTWQGEAARGKSGHKGGPCDVRGTVSVMLSY